MTKKQQGFYDSYLRSNFQFLHQCYSSYSYEKARAFNWCLQKCGEMKGINPRIISFNTFGFTMAWEYVKEDTCQYHLHVETPRNTYDFPIEIAV